MATVTDLDRHWTVPELAEKAGVSRQYIGRLARDGQLEAVRTPHGFLIAPDVAEAYLASRKERNDAAA